MGKSNKMPKGWWQFSNCGEPIPGSPFVAFKTPLREELLRCVEVTSFTPNDVLSQLPHLKLVINLTKAPNGRYYDYNIFRQAGIKVEQIVSEGHGVIPPAKMVKRFFKIVDTFLASNPGGNGVIGVHCTHGLNRTGFFICKYLIKRLNMPPNDAVRLFETSRGHRIERRNYVEALGCGRILPPSTTSLNHMQQSSSSGQSARSYARRQRQEGNYIPNSETPGKYNSSEQRSGSKNWRQRHNNAVQRKYGQSAFNAEKRGRTNE